MYGQLIKKDGSRQIKASHEIKEHEIVFSNVKVKPTQSVVYNS